MPATVGRRSPRVLLLSDLFPTEDRPQGGSFVTERVLALQNHGAEVDAVALRMAPSPVLASFLLRSGRDPATEAPGIFFNAPYRLSMIEWLRRRRQATWPRLARRIADGVQRVIGDKDYDLVHAHGMYGANAGTIAREVSRRLGVPYVVTLHGSDINQNMQRDPKAFTRTLRDAAAAIYVSDALRQTAIGLGAPSFNARQIPNGVDADLFVPSTKDSEHPLIAFVGGLAEVKGADRLPAIFRGVADRVPLAYFEVVGDGGLRCRLQDEMADLPVTFHGHVARAQVADVLARASVLVVPSRSEGWPCVVHEAHAAGAFVVASNVGGLGEAVADDRFLAPESAGPDGLVDRIIWALDQDNGSLRPNALNFTWQHLALQEIEMYRMIQSKSSSTPKAE